MAAITLPAIVSALTTGATKVSQRYQVSNGAPGTRNATKTRQRELGKLALLRNPLFDFVLHLGGSPKVEFRQQGRPVAIHLGSTHQGGFFRGYYSPSSIDEMHRMVCERAHCGKRPTSEKRRTNVGFQVPIPGHVFQSLVEFSRCPTLEFRRQGRITNPLSQIRRQSVQQNCYTFEAEFSLAVCVQGS